MNTHQINQLISNLKFDAALMVVDQFVFVNLDWLTNRDYQNQGVNELIYTAGQYSDKIFVFLIRDGVNCRLSGLEYVVKTIVKNLDLTAETCLIYGYDDLEIPNTTYMALDVIQMWCHLVYEQLQNYQYQTTELSKKFAALFGRHELYRLKICKYLKDNFEEYSILSYNSHKGGWNQRFEVNFKNDSNWYQNNCPILLDFETGSGWVPYQQSLSNIVKHVQSYFIEIVCETDVHSCQFFTEKTLKNFYLKKPFILMSGQYSLKTLHDRGFKTFSPWIDESYDNIACPYKRLAAIFDQIDKLNCLSLERLTEINQEMTGVFEHNKQNFLKFV